MGGQLRKPETKCGRPHPNLVEYGLTPNKQRVILTISIPIFFQMSKSICKKPPKYGSAIHSPVGLWLMANCLLFH